MEHLLGAIAVLSTNQPEVVSAGFLKQETFYITQELAGSHSLVWECFRGLYNKLSRAADFKFNNFHFKTAVELIVRNLYKLRLAESDELPRGNLDRLGFWGKVVNTLEACGFPCYRERPQNISRSDLLEIVLVTLGELGVAGQISTEEQVQECITQIVEQYK